MGDQLFEATIAVLEDEKRRAVRKLVDALFIYNERRDSFVLRYPEVTEYSSEALRQMAGL